MTSIATSGTVNNALVRIDQVCDYVPLASTISNLVDIFEKCVFRACCSSESINSNLYFSHINDKSILRCVTLLVPILGNIVVGIYDLIQKHRAEISERETQNFQAIMLGLEVNQLPKSISERRQIIKNKQQEKLQEATQQSIKAFDTQITAMREYIKKFKEIIDNPNEPLEVVRLFGLIRGTYDGTHREKIDYFWSNLKLTFAFQDLGSICLSLATLDQNETISQKQQEISELKKELYHLRQTSYRGYIQAAQKEELLQEAKKYYLESLSAKERKGVKISVEQMTLDSILPKLKERVSTNTEKYYDTVEMQEIISQIEHT